MTREAGDIILVIKQKPHPLFVRRGEHLYMRARVTLREALCGVSLSVRHVDGRTLRLYTRDDVLSPGCLRMVRGEGLPLKDCGGLKRGLLVVQFDLVFPRASSISSDCRDQLEGILRGVEDVESCGDGASANSASPSATAPAAPDAAPVSSAAVVSAVSAVCLTTS